MIKGKAIATSLLLLAALLSIGNNRCGSASAAEYRTAEIQAAIAALLSPIDEERKSAAFKLTEMGSEAKSAVPTLIEILRTDTSMQIRGEVAHALGKIGPAAESSVPAIVSFLQSAEGGYERTYAASALGDIGEHADQAVPALINALQHDQEPVVQRLAARALGDFGKQGGDAVPALIEAIQTGDRDLRTAAEYGLSRIPARGGDVASLLVLLDDDIDSVRAAAAKSLTGLGEEAVSATPKLTKLLKSKNSEVREAAVNALGAIGPGAKQSLPELKKCLQDAEIQAEVRTAIDRITNHTK